MVKKEKVNSNFGKWGWSMILYAAVSYYIAAGVSTDGLNFFPTAFQTARGWDAGLITTICGLAGWIGIIGAFLFSQMVAKKGVKFTTVAGNIVTGLVMFVFAVTNSFPVFVISLILLVFISGNLQLNAVPNTLMNIWFPAKKGIALGWASMGMPLCTATFVALMTVLTSNFGISKAYIFLGIAIILFGIISVFWVKEKPEDVGAFPDNEELTQAEAKSVNGTGEDAAKQMTLVKIAKNPNTWLIGIGHGFLWMTTVGIVSQFIPRLLSMGYDMNKALLFLTAAAVVGIVGSYFWGWLDQMIGTREASVIYGIWYLAALLLLIFGNNDIMMYIATFFVGVGIGGIGNLIPSMIGTCFGRYGFIQANRLIAPVNTLIRCTAFIIAGISTSMTGGLTAAYSAFMVCSVLGIIMISRIKVQK